MTGAVLHRCRLPTDRLCPCGRVARRLRADGYAVEEHRAPWRARDREAVEGLTGQTRVPVVVIGRDVICDSRRILEHLAWRRRPAA